MRIGQGVRTSLEHGGITCVLQTQFSSFFMKTLLNFYEFAIEFLLRLLGNFHVEFQY